MGQKQIVFLIGIMLALVIAAGIYLVPQLTDDEGAGGNATDNATIHQESADQLMADAMKSDAPNATSKEEESGEPALDATGSEQEETVASTSGDEQSSLSDRDRFGPEDAVFSTDFLEDLAQYCVDHYYPAQSVRNPSTAGLLTLSYKTLNQRYGLEGKAINMTAPDAYRLRKKVLAYAFQPGVLQFLYKAYGGTLNYLVMEYATEAQREFSGPEGVIKRKLTPAEVTECLASLATFTENGALFFAAYAKNPQIGKRVGTYLKASEKVNDVYASYLKVEADAGAKEAGTEVKKAIISRETARGSIIASIRDAAPELRLTDDEIIYLSQWAYRRVTVNGFSKSTLVAISTILDDLASRLVKDAMHESES